MLGRFVGGIEMKAKEKYDKIWNEICEIIKSDPRFSKMTLSAEHSRGWCDGESWYGSNMFSNDDYIHIIPIEKCGREVFGAINWSIFPIGSFSTYKTLEEFKKELDDVMNEFSNVLKKKVEM